jgi:hypothetical protein
VANGTCKGQPKPSWQGSTTVGTASTVLGNPADGVRDIPDVSLFAANGVWGHFLVICYTDVSGGGEACTLPIQPANTSGASWSGVGGTSASSPMMAGIQTLVNQYVGTTTNGNGALQGNPNYVYYNLANQEYGASGSTACNSTLGNGIGASCVFNDVTLGDMNVPCRKDGTTGTFNCYDSTGTGITNGVGSVTNTAYSPTYGTTTGWDFPTGIGSVNAYNLATNWRNAFPTTTALTLGSATNSGTGTDKLTATVSAATLDNANSGGTQIAIIGGVTFYDGASSIGTCTITTAASCSYTATGTQFMPGSNSITAVYAGNNAYPGSTSSASNITQTDGTTTTASASPTTITTAGSTSVTATVTDSTTATNLPTGTVNFNLTTSGGTALGSCTLTTGTSSSSCSATVQGSALALGSNTIVASYQGVTGYAASSGSTSVTVTSAGGGNITFSSVSHNFGSEAVGTAAPNYSLSLTNSGSTAFPFAIVFTPANGFTEYNNCGTSVAAGKSCTILFEFTPTATGTVTASWSLTPQTGFTFSPSNGGTLTGTGTSAGGVTITTNGHNFGTVTDGTTSPVYGVVLTNSTASAVAMTYGSVTSPFITYVDNCPASLASGASCNLQFEFAPTTPGTTTQTFSLSANGGAITITAGGVASTGIKLTGTGD